MRPVALGTALNLAWIIPTCIFAGAPLWVCLMLPLMAVAMGAVLASV